MNLLIKTQIKTPQVFKSLNDFDDGINDKLPMVNTKLFALMHRYNSRMYQIFIGLLM